MALRTQERERMSAALTDLKVAWKSILSLAAAVLVAIWSLAPPPCAQATDKLAAPGAVKGQETTVTVRPDGEAGEFERQGLEILNNGTVTCGEVELTGTIFARVIGHVTFKAVHFGACVYLGQPARLNTSSCDVVITSGGLGKFTNRENAKCNVRVEILNCIIHLGKGPFLELGYHNVGSPSVTTAVTEPRGIGGFARGVGCLSPGPDAIAQYRGYLNFSASRNGAKKPFTVIL